MAVYSEDRARRLRILLLSVVALAGILAAFAVISLVAQGVDGPRVASLVAAGLLVASGASAVLLLKEAETPAKVGTLVTGGLCVLAGIASAGSWLSLVLPLLGLGLLFLALVADTPELKP
jgi:hypothetical protein